MEIKVRNEQFDVFANSVAEHALLAQVYNKNGKIVYEEWFNLATRQLEKIDNAQYDENEPEYDIADDETCSAIQEKIDSILAKNFDGDIYNQDYDTKLNEDENESEIMNKIINIFGTK